MAEAFPLEIRHIINRLQQIKGLNSFYLLDDSDRKVISEVEASNNLGVFESLNRQFVVCCTHDSTFREATQKIVVKQDGQKILPPISFPEVPARNVVSSSPGIKSHLYLAEKVHCKKGDATLLIGFDLE